MSQRRPSSRFTLDSIRAGLLIGAKVKQEEAVTP